MLTNKLRDLYGVTEDKALFNTYEKFETFKRLKSMTISDDVNEFEQINRN